MKIIGRFIVFVILVGLTGYVLYSAYSEVETKTIEQLNAQQMTHARQAARGIEDYFESKLNMLAFLSKSEHIINLDEEGRQILALLYYEHSEGMSAISRVDADGRIMYTMPYTEGMIGADLSDQVHIRDLMLTRQVTLSDVFTAVQGGRAMALHVPIRHKGEFRGSIAIFIPYEKLTKEYLAPIQIGANGHAWIISRNGTELYSPVAGRTGSSVFEASSRFPSAISMVEKMLKGEEGVTTYSDEIVENGRTEVITRHAVFLPVRMANTFWSIVVSTPEDEVLALMKGFRNRWLLMVVILMAASLIYAYSMAKAWAIIREENRREQTEKALRGTNQLLNALIESSPLGINITAPDGTVKLWNPASERIFGWSRDEIVDKPLPTLTPEIEAEFNTFFTALLQGHAYTALETRRKRKDGTVIDVNLSGAPVRDDTGRIIGGMGIIEDITGRKKTEEERVRLASAVEQAAEVIFITDHEGTIQYVNPAFERITGYEKGEALHRNVRILASGKHNKDFYQQVDDTLARGETWTGRFINRKKNGSLFEVEATISPVRDASGKIINHVAVERDVTQEVGLERQLRQAQKMEAIGTLAGGIAHDFNNILGIILGYTEMAMVKIDNRDIAEKSLAEVLKAGHRAKELVRQILAFSRHGEYELRPVQASLIVKEALRLLRSSLPSTIEINRDISNTGVVVADPSQIHQIVMNLCTNAHHAMREKGGVLTVAMEDTELDESAVAQCGGVTPGPYLKLTVRDTGQGMDASIMERIFDPYFTTKDQGEGTGLGLAVVHGIVKNLGGVIAVESELGKGSAFHVFLPRTERRQSTARRPAGESPSGKERILFVDDEVELAKVADKMLTHLGYAVSSHTSSTEALERFRDRPDRFDLIITDHTMPNLTGIDLARECLRIRPDIPIIICTGFSERLNEDVAKATGIRQFVMKPLVTDDLARIIRKVLDRR